MKNSIKRLSLALLVLGITSPVLADVASPFDVTIPNQQGGLTFGADALYMRGTAPNLGFAATFGPASPIILTGGESLSGTLNSVDSSYQWGFDATLGYRFPGTGLDLTATWTHLGNFDDSDSTTDPFNLEDIIVGTFQQSGSVEFNYDAVDLDLGQRVNFGDSFNFHLFAGGRWADVKEDRSNSYPETFTSATPTVTVGFDEDINSDFRGIGPQLGFDGRYCLGYGLGIDAGVTASLLVGDVDANNNTLATTTAETIIGPVLVASDAERLSQDDFDRVVPALDANIGLDYTYAFANCDRSYLTVQAGYKVINYFDAAQNTFEHDPATDNIGFTTHETLGSEANNIAFDGPYAGVKVNL